MAPVLAGKQVVLGVTGGIAAYKAVDLASSLVQLGATVHVVMTDAAAEFVGEATFGAITGQPVHRDLFEPWTPTSKGHITLGHIADLLVVAPATADSLARLAHGFANDMLSTVALSTSAPLVVAPAMEHNMFHHPATRRSLAILRERGVVVVGPDTGRLASGERGDGRLAATADIVGAIRVTLGQDGSLRGRRVVVTAGGTQEPIDPVRYIGNRSSGVMGYAIAQAALDAGADVTLVTGPVALTTPWGCDVVQVRTALEMNDAVHAAVAGADILVMAAAVADYRPTQQHLQKWKKNGDDPAAIELTENPDILAGIDQPGLVKVGFAAETQDIVRNATAKLAKKGLDLIVANDAVEAIGSPDNAVTLLYQDGRSEALASMPKGEVAAILVERIAALGDPG